MFSDKYSVTGKKEKLTLFYKFSLYRSRRRYNLDSNCMSICRVPDDYLLQNKRPLLMSREVLAAAVAGWTDRELEC